MASTPTTKQYPTIDQIKAYWERTLANEKVGIGHLCPEGEKRQKQAEKAEVMARTIMDNGCKRELAIQLTILALYDLVLLVDNSISMGFPENKSRVETLQYTLKQVAGLYTLVSENYDLESKQGGGIVSVKFLNPFVDRGYGYRNVTPGKAEWIVDEVGFRGLTRIGTELLERVLKEYADVENMKRPLLVVIFTDGEIEGESERFLHDVINITAVMHEEKAKGRAHLISYQFVAVGDDPGARDLLQSLDDDEKIGNFIDCLYGEDLERLKTNPKDNRWEILPKLFLGSILDDWDEHSIQSTSPIPPSSTTALQVEGTNRDDQDAPETGDGDWL